MRPAPESLLTLERRLRSALQAAQRFGRARHASSADRPVAAFETLLAELRPTIGRRRLEPRSEWESGSDAVATSAATAHRFINAGVKVAADQSE